MKTCSTPRPKHLVTNLSLYFSENHICFEAIRNDTHTPWTKDDTDNSNGCNEIAENFPQCMCIAQHMLGNGCNKITEIFPQCMHTHSTLTWFWQWPQRNRRNFPTMHAHSTTHTLGNGRNKIAEIFPQCMHTAQLTCSAMAATKSRKFSHNACTHSTLTWFWQWPQWNRGNFPTMHAHSTTHTLGNGCNEIAEIFPQCMHIAHSHARQQLQWNCGNIPTFCPAVEEKTA